MAYKPFIKLGAGNIPGIILCDDFRLNVTLAGQHVPRAPLYVILSSSGKQAGALWTAKDKNGIMYLSGTILNRRVKIFPDRYAPPGVPLYNVMGVSPDWDEDNWPTVMDWFELYQPPEYPGYGHEERNPDPEPEPEPRRTNYSSSTYTSTTSGVKPWYELLGVSRSASVSDLKAAFRKLALLHHPDKKGGNAEMFMRYRQAYEDGLYYNGGRR